MNEKRKEYDLHYQIQEDNTVGVSGRYKGQPAYVPHFLELAVAGAGENLPIVGTPVIYYAVPVDAADLELFPELRGKQCIYLRSSRDLVVEVSPPLWYAQRAAFPGMRR